MHRYRARYCTPVLIKMLWYQKPIPHSVWTELCPDKASLTTEQTETRMDLLEIKDVDEVHVGYVINIANVKHSIFMPV